MFSFPLSLNAENLAMTRLACGGALIQSLPAIRSTSLGALTGSLSNRSPVTRPEVRRSGVHPWIGEFRSTHSIKCVDVECAFTGYD
jgi:hypothetical protein